MHRTTQYMPMHKTKHALEAGLIILFAAVLYWLGFELQNWLFKFTEVIPGVNWFYLPGGLRVVLVWVGGIYGATGIFVATMLIDVLHIQDIQGLMFLGTGLVSGFGPLLALHLVWPRHSWQQQSRLTSTRLLTFAGTYALLNAVLHQAVWWYFQREGSVATVDFWPMFIGDLTGSVTLLYLWKFALTVRNRALAH